MKGKLVGEDFRKEVFVPKQTRIYRFDFDIDNVNLDYGFYLYYEKELVDSAYYYECTFKRREVQGSFIEYQQVGTYAIALIGPFQTTT